MKKKYLITLFLIKRISLILKLLVRKTREKNFRLKVKHLSLHNSGDTFKNQSTISFEQSGALGIMIEQMTFPIVGKSGKIVVPQRLLKNKTIEITFFSMFQSKTKVFRVNESIEVYPLKSKLKKQKWISPRKLTRTLVVKNLGAAKASILPRPTFNISHKSISEPLIKVNTPKIGLNLSDLNEQLKNNDHE